MVSWPHMGRGHCGAWGLHMGLYDAGGSQRACRPRTPDGRPAKEGSKRRQRTLLLG